MLYGASSLFRAGGRSRDARDAVVTPGLLESPGGGLRSLVKLLQPHVSRQELLSAALPALEAGAVEPDAAIEAGLLILKAALSTYAIGSRAAVCPAVVVYLTSHMLPA